MPLTDKELVHEVKEQYKHALLIEDLELERIALQHMQDLRSDPTLNPGAREMARELLAVMKRYSDVHLHQPWLLRRGRVYFLWGWWMLAISLVFLCLAIRSCTAKQPGSSAPVSGEARP